jgi:hypothetical protein
MTASTRNRLMFCAIVGLITIPAEAMLLPVARTPNPAVAAVKWTAGLDKAELRSAASNIEAYPALYRRAIMGALTPEDRSNAWREFFQDHISSHPSLTSEQVAVLREAIDVASPAAFSQPMAADVKQRIGDVFGRATKVLGANAANELFVTLGPKQLQVANALPLSQQLADKVRSWRVVSANEQSGCNCNIEIDTCDLLPDPWLQCSELFTCEFDLSWPMCGPLWSWACTGWCKIIRFPWDN